MAKKIAIGAALAGVKTAVELFDQLDKDDRASTAVKSLGSKIAQAAKSTTPQQRLDKQLALVEDYATKAAARPAQADDAERWLRQAESIRERLPLVAAMKGRAGKKAFKGLELRTRDLLVEIIDHDVDATQP